MRNLLIGLTAASAVVGAPGAALADDGREGVPALDHVFVLVLENHNSFTSFGSNGILDNPKAPHIQALAKKSNFAANYNAVQRIANAWSERANETLRVDRSGEGIDGGAFPIGIQAWAQ